MITKKMDGAELIVFSVCAAGVVITAIGSNMLAYGYFDEESDEDAENPVFLSFYTGFPTFLMGFCKAGKKLFVDRSHPLVVALFIFLSGLLIVGASYYLHTHPEVLEGY